MKKIKKKLTYGRNNMSVVVWARSCRRHLPSFLLFSIVCSAEMNFDWEELETSQLLYEMYGFVHPLPLPTQPSSLSQNDRHGSLLSVIVGLQRNDTDFLKSPVASFALEFLELLNASKTPKNTTWDIVNGNRMSISGSGLFRRMRVIERTGNPGGEDKWFVFDFKEAATVPWMVAVPNVIDAFFVCRLDHPRARGSPITDFEVARELLDHRIQFSSSQALAMLNWSCNHCPTSSAWLQIYTRRLLCLRATTCRPP